MAIRLIFALSAFFFLVGGVPVIAPVMAQTNVARAKQPSGPVIITAIRVEGNQRIEAETIRSYLLVSPGDFYRAALVDQSLKRLFATGLFADVSIRRDGSVLVINVAENPIINRLAFEGNKKLKEDKLSKEVQLRPRIVFTRSKVQADVQRIIELYRRSGRFAATVEPKVIELPQNRVDLVFEITEGAKTGVRRINFIGNRDFSDSDLRGEIRTRESRWWRFLTSDDNYDPDRLMFDRELLRQFYLSKGYADFRVISAVAELTPDRKDFFITFTIEEGKVYTIGKVDVTSQIRDLDPKLLRPLLKNKPGRRYNAKEIDDTIDRLTEVAGLKGYAFVNIRPRIRRERDKQIINITYRVLEAPRVYVEKINITGNVRTLDRVIRREFRLVEGDAFNSAKLRRSRLRIRGLGFFKDVQVEQTEGSAPDRTVIEATVQEQSTGELSIGAGFSSRDKLVGEISIRERNLLGKGQDLRLALSASSRRQQIDLGFTEPYFMGRAIAAGIDLFTRRTDFQNQASFDESSTGFNLRTGFGITEYLSMTARYTLRLDNIHNISPFASRFILDAAGKFTTSSVSYSLGYDKRNDRIRPTRGYDVIFSQEFAGVGGNVRYLRNRINYEYYHPMPFLPKLTFNFSMEEGYIIGLGKDIRLNDRFFLGGVRLRGFNIAGVGPRTDDVRADSLGGNLYYAGTFEIFLPFGQSEEFGIIASTFVDFGTLAKVGQTSLVNDDGSIIRILQTGSTRISAGFGFSWKSPFGPIRFDFAKAIRKEPFDRTQFFQFNVGTRF